MKKSKQGKVKNIGPRVYQGGKKRLKVIFCSSEQGELMQIHYKSKKTSSSCRNVVTNDNEIATVNRINAFCDLLLQTTVEMMMMMMKTLQTKATTMMTSL